MKEEGPGHDKHVLAAHDLRRSDRYDVYREDDARLHDVSFVKRLGKACCAERGLCRAEFCREGRRVRFALATRTSGATHCSGETGNALRGCRTRGTRSNGVRVIK